MQAQAWNHKLKSPLLALLASLSLSTVAQTSGNTPAASGELEEITVTATRRSERLQDVAVAVTAFTQEKLDAQGLRDIDDLTRLSPGVVFQRNGAGTSANYNDENSDINIRGIDSNAGSSTVGVYIDDTPIQSRHIGFASVSTFPALFDIERVEVLRGPQGTLFGAGSEGGTVRFITPQPSLTDSSAYVRSELAATKDGSPSYELGAAAGTPIIDDVLGFRVSASFRDDGGYVDRVAYTPGANGLAAPTYLRDVEPDSNWQHTTTFRAALKWAVNDALSITPSVYYQELQINDTGAYWTNLSNPNSGIFRNGNALPDTSVDPLSVEAVRVDWNLSFAQLVSNTSYYERHQHAQTDYTQFLGELYLFDPYRPPGDAGYADFDDKQKNFYQEIRLTSSDATAPVTWSAGIFYSHQNESVPENFYDSTINAEGGACAAVPCPNGLLYTSPVNQIIDKQTALFGETTVMLTQGLKATVGMRVSKVDYTGTSTIAGAFISSPLTNPIVSSGSGSEKPVTPKFVLAYQADRDDLFYVSAAKGYRVGGINPNLGSVPLCAGSLNAIGSSGNPTSYASDSVWSYELGAKNTLLDGRLQINTSLYTINWKNIQQEVYLTSCGLQFAANLGEARSHGGELEVQYKPIDPLLLNFSAAYMKANYTKTSCAAGLEFDGSSCVSGGLSAAPIVSNGDALLGAPWTLLASAEYEFGAREASRQPYFRVDYQESTAQTAQIAYQDPRNGLNDTSLPGLPLNRNLSLRAGLRWSGFDVSLFVNNLTNQHPLLFESRDFPPNTGVLNDDLYFAHTIRPLTVGATTTYRY
jgi:iron complex outermembrane recepter protein